MHDARRGLQDPRAFVGVRVDHHGRQVKSGDPFTQWAGVANEGGELGVEGRCVCHSK